MTLPEKTVSSVAKQANEKGKWNLSSFKYNSFIEISDRLLQSNQEEAYIIKALTYYMNGELSTFLEYASKLFDVFKNFNTFNIYLTALHTNGQLEKTISVFDKYVEELSTPEDCGLILLNHITYARYALDNATLERNHKKFHKILSKEMIDLIMNTMKLNQRDLGILEFAKIERGLFLEVMGVAIQTLNEVGNFVTGYTIKAKHPNDDLILSIHGQKIDIELMHELNESWLDKIVDHDSEYSFEQLSRVLVNFQPGNCEGKEEYVS